FKVIWVVFYRLDTLVGLAHVGEERNIMMKLKGFRVTNFRSVEDSGWIEVDDVAALIGMNESGKTNIVLPLWKLSPAKEGAISPTADYPRKLYNTFRHQSPKPVFIRAAFEVDGNLAE